MNDIKRGYIDGSEDDGSITYDVQMQSMNAKLDMILDGMREMREELKNQRKDIDQLTHSVSVMSERIDRNFDTLSARIDGLDVRLTETNQNLASRIDDMKQYIYLVLVLLGIAERSIYPMPPFSKIFRSEAAPCFLP